MQNLCREHIASGVLPLNDRSLFFCSKLRMDLLRDKQICSFIAPSPSGPEAHISDHRSAERFRRLKHRADGKKSGEKLDCTPRRLWDSPLRPGRSQRLVPYSKIMAGPG
jgi:hypothetical protein